MTAAQQPPVPDERAREVAGQLHGVDISGGASTVGRDAWTVGDDSVAKAFRNGFTAQLGSPVRTPLMIKYAEALEKARSEPTPAEREAKAHKRGWRHYVKRLTKGDSNPTALAKGFARYKEHGGKLSNLAWVRKCGK